MIRDAVAAVLTKVMTGLEIVRTGLEKMLVAVISGQFRRLTAAHARVTPGKCTRKLHQ
jgi:hypothetical protein